MRQPRQHASPVWVESADSVLHPQRMTAAPFDENTLQGLLAAHPEILPMRELEPAYSSLIFVGRELQTPAGPIDLVYVTANGGIVLVETKLWKNTDARRTVVAQILDYAKELTKWGFDEFDKKVAAAMNGRSLLSIAKAATEGADEVFDEAAFTDAISKNLRRCRLLLLIVGEGIREGIEDLTSLIQDDGARRFSLALVETAMFRASPKSEFPLLIVPRIVSRTTEVVRSVVEIRDGVVSTAAPLVVTPDAPSSNRRTTLSEEALLQEMARAAPGAERVAETLLERFRVRGYTLQFRQAAVSVRVEAPAHSGVFFTLLVITKVGTAYAGFLTKVRNSGYPTTGVDDYVRALAEQGFAYNERTDLSTQVPLLTLTGHLDALVGAAERFAKHIITAADDAESNA